MTQKKNASAVALGRLGGSANTKKQNAARKKNAQFAGRPGRICKVCDAPVQGSDLAKHDACALWTWQKPAERE